MVVYIQNIAAKLKESCSERRFLAMPNSFPSRKGGSYIEMNNGNTGKTSSSVTNDCRVGTSPMKSLCIVILWEINEEFS